MSSVSTPSSPVPLVSVSDVHNFWFLGFANEKLNIMENANEMSAHWFMGRGGKDFDDVQIAATQLIHDAGNGLLTSDEWQTPKGCLSRVVLLDQFPRTVFRGTTLAFKYDPVAALIVRELESSGQFYSEFMPLEQFVLIVSLQHSEDINDHILCSKLLSHIVSSTAKNYPDASSFFNPFLLDFFVQHRTAVEKFGRYPSRNAALGRESTPAELEWLSSPDLPGWAKSQIAPAAK